MEGPKEIFVPAHTYKACTHCKHFKKEGYVEYDTGRPGINFRCLHPDRMVGGFTTFLWNTKERQDAKFKVRIETPDWCPYLDSNNMRKVLVEKDMNCNKD